MPEGELAYGLVQSFNPSDMVGYVSHKLVLCIQEIYAMIIDFFPFPWQILSNYIHSLYCF